MFLHVGGDMVVPMDDLIAIINLETGCKKEATREFLSLAAEDRSIVHICVEKRRKSIILTKRCVYFSPISTTTLLKRAHLKKFQRTG